MGLKDTVELMNSNDYKERFKAEYYQLQIRYEQLNKFVNIIKACANDQYHDQMPDYDCTFDVLEQQLDVMKEYLDILQQRAFMEKIDL